MIHSLKANKNLINYFLLFMLLIPIFGFKLIFSIISNIFIIIFLVPILILIIAFISLYSLRSNLKTCNNCGAKSFGVANNCINCGSEINENSKENYGNLNNASQTTIEVKAEEIN